MPNIRYDVDLWYAWTGKLSDPGLGRRYRELLPLDEIEGVDRFAREPDRRRGLMARVLARTALSHYTDVAAEKLRFTRDSLGKPELVFPENSGVSFNLSHTGELVLCAVARQGVVGVDAEMRSRRLDFLPLARRFFAREEVEAIERTEPGEQPQAFFAVWTLKEAYIKACGRGLTMPLTGFAFDWGPSKRPGLLRTAPGYGDANGWRFAQVELADLYQAAVALWSDGSGPLSLRIFDALPLVRDPLEQELPPNESNRWAM